jgi:hypothetical protein
VTRLAFILHIFGIGLLVNANTGVPDPPLTVTNNSKLSAFVRYANLKFETKPFTVTEVTE